MIQLTRDLTKVAARFANPKRSSDNRVLFTGGFGGDPKPASVVWKAAKKQLKTESSGKCAYCEAPTSTVAHGDVEHFRPKDVYWWWAYCYFNYAYGCQVCNQSNKGVKFPLASGAAPIAAPAQPAALDVATLGTLIDAMVPNPFDGDSADALAMFRYAIRAEGGLLIDPYEDEPESFFKYVVKTGTKAVEIHPATASGKKRRRAMATIEVLGLNREELVEHRFKIFRPLQIARIAFASPDPTLHDPAREELIAAMETGSDHAGMSRYFVVKEWKLPVAGS